MRAAIELFYLGLKAVIAGLLALMVCLVFGNVVLRYGFNSGISVSDELSRWSMVWMTFLGAVVALRERQHLGVDFLVRSLPRAGRKLCLTITLALMIWATWLLLAGSWKQAVLNLHVPGAVLPVSTGYFYYGAGVAFGLLALPILVHELFRVVTGRATDEELVAVAENEDEAALKSHAGSPVPAAPARNG